MIAVHTPISLEDCVCEKFPEGEVPTSGTVVCAKVDLADGALHCTSRNADYRGDDGGALTWSGCRSDMTACKYAAVAPSTTTTPTACTGPKRGQPCADDDSCCEGACSLTPWGLECY